MCGRGEGGGVVGGRVEGVWYQNTKQSAGEHSAASGHAIPTVLKYLAINQPQLALIAMLNKRSANLNTFRDHTLSNRKAVYL
jgi:hypothetical protein